MPQDDLKKRVGFYTARPFWAGDPVEPHQIELLERGHLALFEFMDQHIWRVECADSAAVVCKDGLIMLELAGVSAQDTESLSEASTQKLIAAWSEYLKHLNAIYLLLDSALIATSQQSLQFVAELTMQDVSGIMHRGDKFSGCGIPTYSHNFGAMFDARHRSSFRYPDQPGWLSMDRRISHRLVVSTVELDKMWTDYCKAKSINGGLAMLARLLKAIGEYKVANYEEALVFAWFIVEPYVNNMWDSFVTSYGSTGRSEVALQISRKRREFLSNVRSFPVSVTSNVLEMLGELDREMFDQIDAVRGYRNAIVHANHKFSCGETECRQALELARRVISEAIGIDLRISLSYSVSSI